MGLTVREREVAIGVVREEIDKQIKVLKDSGIADQKHADLQAQNYIYTDDIISRIEKLKDYKLRVESLTKEAVEFGKETFDMLEELDRTKDGYYDYWNKPSSAEGALEKVSNKAKSANDRAKVKFFNLTPAGVKIQALQKVYKEAESKIMLCTAPTKLLETLEKIMQSIGSSFDT